MKKPLSAMIMSEGSREKTMPFPPNVPQRTILILADQVQRRLTFNLTSFLFNLSLGLSPLSFPLPSPS